MGKNLSQNKKSSKREKVLNFFKDYGILIVTGSLSFLKPLPVFADPDEHC